MGLRASDIVKIRLYDINWNCQTIRILQKKTLHEIELPMPTDVGNSIYLYIKNGRPDTGSTYLFVKSKIPYDAVSRNACRYALISTLPDRHKPYSGFHVTRKTFATDQISKNIAKNIIADMLGHRDASTLSHYLNLDSEHMRMCPLSLGETDLTMKGGRYD
jgi:integrase